MPSENFREFPGTSENFPEMENPYLPYAGQTVGPDGHRYTCALGWGKITPQGAAEVEIRAQDPNARLIIPTGAIITQLAIALPQALMIGLPFGRIALMRSRLVEPEEPAVILTANSDGMIGMVAYSSQGLRPGVTHQFFRPESLRLRVLGEPPGSSVVIRTADETLGEVFAAVWYASPIHPL